MAVLAGRNIFLGTYEMPITKERNHSCQLRRSPEGHERSGILDALFSCCIGRGPHMGVSFRHCLKAALVVEGITQRLRDLGFTQAELRAVYPVMLHVEALAYQGDLTYEESQKRRSSTTGV